MNFKDKTELIGKKADITYKKLVVLLASAGGSGSYAISNDGVFQILYFVIFSFFVVGIIINYLELNSLKEKLEEIGKNEH